ncbi:MAG TPA: PilZ domain-containing protein [Candidatus Dormibacteraeota bacterium]|nr:PilZ domain-containing protein [Candidatus Dormibacteraeota bacterium]
MAGNERRTSARKLCTLPLRFRVTANGHNDAEPPIEADRETSAVRTATVGAEYIGKALNLSERGLYFTCREDLRVGQPLEMHFTLPQELTGRAPENVRCSARVVHVDDDGQAGLRGIGACVEGFEPMAAIRNWAN